MTRKGIYFIFIYTIILSPIFASTVYYVDVSSGNDQNDGLSTTSAWKNISKANSTLQAGDTVYIREGNYVNQQIYPQNSGTSGNYIVYQNYENETPIISGSELNAGAYLHTGKNYIKIDGITITGTVQYGIRMRSSYNIVQNCTITYVQMYKGIYSHDYSDYNLIQHNTIDYIGHTEEVSGFDMGNGIQVKGNYNLVQYNNVYRCGHNCIEVNGTYNIARSNYMENEWGRCIESDGPTPADDHLVVQDNIIYNTQLRSDSMPNPGYQCRSAYTIFRRNRIFKISGVGIHLDAWLAINPSYMKIYHNVVYESGLYGEKQWDKAIALTEHENGCLIGVAIRNNIFYHNYADGISYREFSDPSDHTVTNNHWNANGSPEFIDEANYNFDLRPNSPCIDAGTWLTTTTSSGSGNQITVEDSTFFCDGYGLIDGDLIQLQGDTQEARIININYNNNLIIIDRPLNWYNGQGVSLAYSGSAPDLGVFEYIQQSDPLQAFSAASPSSGYSPLSVSFTGSATGGTQPYSYTWDFGDGNSSSTQNSSHIFSQAGNYTVTLTVTDNSSSNDTATLNINVSQPIPPLLASASASPSSGNAPLIVNFTGSATGGSQPYTYAWNFGDGSSSSDQNPSHTFSQAGDFTVTLTVSDNLGTTDTATLNINVSQQVLPLDAAMTATPASGYAPLPVNFTGSATGGTPPYIYSWDFGDTETSSDQNPSHTYNQSGNFTVSLTVTDSQGAHDTTNTEISVLASVSESQLTIQNITGNPAPGEGGSTTPVPGNYTYSTGTEIKITASPYENYRFAKWTGDIGTEDAYDPDILLILSQNKMIQANFYTQCGDVNGDLHISPADAQMVFELFLGLAPDPSEAQWENADVNCDGTETNPNVTPADAQAIFEKFLGLNELPGDCSCKTRALNSTTSSTQISGIPPNFGPVLSINDILLIPGKEIRIPVLINGPFSFKSFGFDVLFPSDIMDFICVEPTELTKLFIQTDGNQIADGAVRIGGYNDKPIRVQSQSVLLKLVFKVKKRSNTKDLFIITNKVDDFKYVSNRAGEFISTR